MLPLSAASVVISVTQPASVALSQAGNTAEPTTTPTTTGVQPKSAPTVLNPHTYSSDLSIAITTSTPPQT